MNECPPMLPQSNDPAVQELGRQIQDLYMKVTSPSFILNLLQQPINNTKIDNIRRGGPTSNTSQVINNVTNNQNPQQIPGFVGDNVWIDVKRAGGSIVTSHIGPGPMLGPVVSGGSLSIAGGSSPALNLSLTVSRYDTKGHVESPSVVINVSVPLTSIDVVTEIEDHSSETDPTFQYRKTRIYCLQTDAQGDAAIWASGSRCTPPA